MTPGRSGSVDAASPPNAAPTLLKSTVVAPTNGWNTRSLRLPSKRVTNRRALSNGSARRSVPDVLRLLPGPFVPTATTRYVPASVSALIEPRIVTSSDGGHAMLYRVLGLCPHALHASITASPPIVRTFRIRSCFKVRLTPIRQSGYAANGRKTQFATLHNLRGFAKPTAQLHMWQ